MKILKYIFLLILLALFGTIVFIATQKSHFDIKKATIIKVPRNIAFNYLNDYKNWESWGAWKEDDQEMKFVYPANTSGKNAYYTWSSDKGEGKTTTTDLKQNEYINQIVNFSGNQSYSSLHFKDTIGGTKVTWTSKGEINFMTKIHATFSGGINKLMGNMFERSLNNLNVILTKELNIYRIINSGMITIPGRYFVKSTVVCKPEEIQSKINMTLPKIRFFFENNNVKMNGKPFVIKDFETIDSVGISVYGPLKEEIFLSKASDLTTGYMESFTALKTALIGDYSHLNEARAKALSNFNQQKLIPSKVIKPMEVYFITIDENKKPSKWQTFIQYPVYEKPIFVKKTYIPKPKTVAPLPEPITEPIKENQTKDEF